MNYLLRKALVVTILLILMSLPGIATGSGNNERTLNNEVVIALVPEKNVFEQRRRYKYITDYLSKKLNMSVRVNIMSNYGDICDAFLEGTADAGFFGSFSYVLTHVKAGVIPIARPVWLDGSSTYRGYIFVRKDSGITSVEDMRGKSLVLVHRATTAGYIFQLYYMQYYDIKSMEDHFSQIYFAGSHDSSAWAVYTGEADVGGGKNHIFHALEKEYPDFSEQMITIAESPAVPSNGIAIRKDLNHTLAVRLKTLFLNLHKTDEGREVLKNFGAEKFIETTNADYRSLYNMVHKLKIDLETFPYKD